MSDFNINSSILPFEIISIFNDYYQLYLNGIDIHIIIDLYITKNLYLKAILRKRTLIIEKSGQVF